MTLDEAVHMQVVTCVMTGMRGAPRPEDVMDRGNVLIAELRDYGLSDVDADRVIAAFIDYRRNKEWFPCLANIIESLPKKIHTEVKKLPRPEMSPEAKALGEKAFAEMRKVVS
jgi:hypothetical protein